jgi:hypothetical protein
MTDPTRPAPQHGRGRRRGRENVMDMVRSLGIVLAIASALLYLHRPPPGTGQRIRVVNPAEDIRGLSLAVPTAFVPASLPAGWRATSTHVGGTPVRLRIGYVTPRNEYAEYDAQGGPAGSFVDEITGHAVMVGTVQAGGRDWQELRGPRGALSLVGETPEVTVVLGGLRDSASLEELRALAEGLTPPTA